MGVEHRYVLTGSYPDALPAIVPGSLDWLQTIMKHAVKQSKEFPDEYVYIEKHSKGKKLEMVRVYQNGSDVTTQWLDGLA
jgi:hypothetical protein